MVTVDQGREHHGLLAVFPGRLVDPCHGFTGLLIRLHEGQGDLHELDIAELAEHAVAEGFSGDAGAVREIKRRSFHGGQPFSVPQKRRLSRVLTCKKALPVVRSSGAAPVGVRKSLFSMMTV